jgi:hypothetical protein
LLHSGHHPKRAGNKMRFASTSAFPTKNGIVQLAASNARQHRRFYEAIGDPAEAKRSSLEERYARDDEKAAKVAAKMEEKMAEENVAWPVLKGGEMADLIGYLLQARGGPGQPAGPKGAESGRDRRRGENPTREGGLR